MSAVRADADASPARAKRSRNTRLTQVHAKAGNQGKGFAPAEGHIIKWLVSIEATTAAIPGPRVGARLLDEVVTDFAPRPR